MQPKALLTAILFFALSISFARAAEPPPQQASRKDKCPVCGMFVYKYPDWVAQIIFRDGSVAFFDGAKDLFKYYLNLKKYNPSKTIEDIAAVYATEYYDMQIINAAGAFFVAGSDVFGPMGNELIPFVTAADAETFKKDHQGRRIYQFEEVNAGVLKSLD